MADTKERANSVFITGLKNAHALENQALELMNRQVERIENYPDVKAKLQQHIQETPEQIARLERILESLGESRPVLKDHARSYPGRDHQELDREFRVRELRDRLL
jgi:ferritin-like metal-binding protein YciE